ncbi:tight adherence protein C [Mycetocola sp. CAN_C7]|uniref:type II secretion system F family protein n=1 Tax=Mycetocola sp. CAN_C7 TaxID=2787724 RepID=UPI001A18545E
MVPVSAASAWAIVLGVVLGLGLCSVVALLPRMGGPTLADRVAPYIVDVSEPARLFTLKRLVDPVPILGTLLAPTIIRLADALGTLLGGNALVQKRLGQAGRTITVRRFRAEQLAWALVGAALGLVVSTVGSSDRTLPGVVAALAPVIGAVCGAVLRDFQLKRSARGRLARITAELPTVLEFMSLSLSAGEGILDSLRRIARVGSGELGREFRVVASAVHTGIPLATALNDGARRIDLPAFTRCVEQLSAALERGSPLSEVLRAQAQDARDDAKRSLLEIAGKKEVAMLVPLVFLILPLSILFAIYPGIFVLQSGF